MATVINMLTISYTHTVHTAYTTMETERCRAAFYTPRELIMMPLNQDRRLDTRDKIILENSKFRPPYHPHELLLQQVRPYRGEPPAVAGFLLYPDNPTKMETTTQEAFCFRPIPLQDKGQQHHHHTIKTGDLEVKDNQRDTSALDLLNQDPVDMKSQYQKDFPPPTSCRQRRTPALPQPDNIGINPAFRIDFCTVQRETFPCWPIGSPVYRHLNKPSGRW